MGSLRRLIDENQAPGLVASFQLSPTEQPLCYLSGYLPRAKPPLVIDQGFFITFGPNALHKKPGQ